MIGPVQRGNDTPGWRGGLGLALGWAAAVLGVVCFGLGLVAAQRGRAVRLSTVAIAEDIAATNRLLDPADLSAIGRIRVQVDQLGAVLVGLRQATAAEVELVLATTAEVERLVAVTGDDLGIAEAMRATAMDLSAKTAKLTQVAGSADSQTSQLGPRLGRIEAQLKAVNGELAALERKLVLLPALGG